jgi:hypothetical protein
LAASTCSCKGPACRRTLIDLGLICERPRSTDVRYCIDSHAHDLRQRVWPTKS